MPQGRFTEAAVPVPVWLVCQPQTRQLAKAPGMGRSRGEDLRSDLFSFAAGHYVLFYREQPGGTVGLFIGPENSLTAVSVLVVHAESLSSRCVRFLHKDFEGFMRRP
jgi:ParE toxin of type II toxin-antitoxin system, parDE